MGIGIEGVINLLRLIPSALCPVAMVVVFSLVKKTAKWAELSHEKQQVIIGCAFGLVACLATHFGVPVSGAQMNVRNASPLIAALLYGGPAGIIAGLIGGIHRWFIVYWGIGVYSRVACSLGTILAGLLGAFFSQCFFKGRRPSWLFAALIGMIGEVTHMLLFFLTKMNDLQTVTGIVSVITFPMVAGSGIAMLLSTLASKILDPDQTAVIGEKRILRILALLMSLDVLIAYILSAVTTQKLQDKIAMAETDSLLSSTLRDTRLDIQTASDGYLLDLTDLITQEVDLNGIYDRNILISSDEEREKDRQVLIDIANKYSVDEINVIDISGTITISTFPEFDFFYMGSQKGGQAEEFLPILDGVVDTYVQPYGPTDHSPEISRKYAAVRIGDKGMIQVGLGADGFHDSILHKVELAAQNRHVGQNGFVMIVGEDLELISSPDTEEAARVLTQFGDQFSGFPKNKVFTLTMEDGNAYYSMFQTAEGFSFLGLLPESEAVFSRNFSIYTGLFSQTLIFMTLFTCIYFLMKGLVTDNIDRVNASLEQITEGNLDTVVDVRGNVEFESLSNDINRTVETLKGYIAAEAQRIDRDLENARSIQLSALPNVFPPYPGRKDFDIYATIDTAREVGGDFYDFFMLENDRFGFLIADVSGKGIPAALYMMTAKALIKSYAETGLEPNDVFTQANEKLCESNDTGMFVTAWLGIVNLQDGTLSYANGGHNRPLIRKAGGAFEYLQDSRPNLFLGGMEGIRYKNHVVQLMPGAEIYLYTDGVTEAMNSCEELYGDTRLLEQLNVCPDEGVVKRLENVKKALDGFVGETPHSDDITMLSFRLNSVGNDKTIILPIEEESFDRAYGFIDRKLENANISEKKTRQIHIIADELCNNVIHYSGADYLSLSYDQNDDDITLIFRDNGKPYDPLEKEDPDISLSAEDRPIGGLGIFMVKKLSSGLDYEYLDGENITSVRVSKTDV